jgi:hypothetical protein
MIAATGGCDPVAIHNLLLGFESDFSADLRCIPMAVRRKLDLAGVKLKLVHWHGLSDRERQQLLDWRDDGRALLDLREWLLQRSRSLPRGPAQAMEPACQAPWQERSHLPDVVRRSCTQLDLQIVEQRWSCLDELQRFALVKLSHPGHEHRNLPSALAEFKLLAGPPPQPAADST